MKKYFAFLLFVLMAFAAGCITDSNEDDNDNDKAGSGGTQSATTYLPLNIGATWSYTEIIAWSHMEESEADTSTLTMTVTGTSEKNGKTYKTLSVVSDWGDGDPYTSETYMRIEGDNIYIYDPEWALKPAAAKKAMPVRKTTSEAEEQLMFKFKQSPGHTWTVSTDSESGEGYSYSETMNATYYGTENVTVAAGTFADCARFNLTSTSTSTYSGESYTYTSQTSIWLAPNVGVVKETDSFQHGEETDSESSQMELTSYNIPQAVARVGF